MLLIFTNCTQSLVTNCTKTIFLASLLLHLLKYKLNTLKLSLPFYIIFNFTLKLAYFKIQIPGIAGNSCWLRQNCWYKLNYNNGSAVCDVTFVVVGCRCALQVHWEFYRIKLTDMSSPHDVYIKELTVNCEWDCSIE